MSTYGEFVTSSYAYASLPSGSFQTESALDSGTAMWFTHNISVLAKENLRHFVSTPIFHGIFDKTNINNGFANLDDVPNEDNPDAGTRDQLNHISWDRRTAWCFGPLPLVADRELSDGRLSVRNVRVDLTYNNGPSFGTSTYYVALTPERVAPRLYGVDGVLAWGVLGDTATGYSSGSVLLQSTVPFAVPSAQELVGSAMGARTPCITGYLWVGQATKNSNAGLMAVDAYETRAESLTP